MRLVSVALRSGLHTGASDVSGAGTRLFSAVAMLLMQVFGKLDLRSPLVVGLLLVSGPIEYAEAQSNAAAVSAQSGPSLNQLFDEAVEKSDEFDTFDWPAKGRVTLAPTILDAYVDFNRRLWNKYGITYLFAPTIMMQRGSQGGSQDFTANEQYNGIFVWRLLNETQIGTGYFVFSKLHLSQLTRTSGADFSQSLGISYFSSDSPANSEVIKGLLWRQDLPGDFLTLLVGHGEIAAVDNGCRYACDDTQSFLSTPLSSNPTRTLPGQGTGVGADFKLTKSMIVEAEVADASGDGTINFGRVFDTGRVAYATALKFENPFKPTGNGIYKFTYYSVDSTGQQGTSSFKKASQGLSIQVDQDFGDLGVFAKYSKTFERQGSIGQFASAGLVWKKPFGYDEDWLGLGVGWVDPTAANTNNEYVAEAYYRLQLTPIVQVTPSAMLVVNPSKNPDTDTEGVFSLRARAHF